MSQLALQAPREDMGWTLSPFLEMGAYESLFMRAGATFKTVADLFRKNIGALPSALVPEREARETAEWVVARLRERGVPRFHVRVHRAGEYPAKLRAAKHPVELLYFRGIWNLVETKSVAVVGTRKPSAAGVKRAKQLVRELVRAEYTIVSGLAEGIDTVAHTTALDEGGLTIGVIGTPLSDTYPAANRELQDRIAREHLLISQVPVRRYSNQAVPQNRLYFPERNVTMAALSDATVIIEAGETSGTLIQARAALQQGRKLFVLDSLFERKDLEWPRKFQERGAIRLSDFDQFKESMERGG